MSLNPEIQSNAKIVAAFAGWSAVLWIALWATPYLYAFNDLIQWR